MKDKINSEDLALIDSVVKKVGIKLFIEYFGAACWVDEDHEEDTKHLIEAFAANIAEDALQLIEKTENGEFEKIMDMVFYAMGNHEAEDFKNLMANFTNTNLPDISRLDV